MNLRHVIYSGRDGDIEDANSDMPACDQREGTRRAVFCYLACPHSPSAHFFRASD